MRCGCAAAHSIAQVALIGPAYTPMFTRDTGKIFTIEVAYTFGVAPHEHGGGTDARFVSMREFSMVRKHAVRMHEYAVESSARQHARVKDECERHECFESASRVQV